MKNKYIFVQIAAYRDPELLNTIRDCMANAAKPENLRISIAWQHSTDDGWDTLDEFKDLPNINILDINYTDAKGVCWARHLLNGQYKGEAYTLQIDSHHRFAKDWDLLYIEMLESLRTDECKKPLLSSYLPSFDPSNDPESRLEAPWIMEFDRYAPEGNIHFKPHTIDNWKELDSPVPARFMSGHFIFADGIFTQEVMYDPEYYFHGEELNLSVRAYMAGYDIFAPHRTYMWHEYTRTGKVRHWDDHSNWDELDKNSHQHHRLLLGMEDRSKKLSPATRSLQDYEKYAGVEFSTRRVHKNTLQNKLAPTSLDDISHKRGLVNFHRMCIDVHKKSLSQLDYDSWAIAFKDQTGTEIYREDAGEVEIQNLLSIPYEQDKFVHIWRSFEHTNKPVEWVVWPHSKSKGWMERLTGIFNSKEKKPLTIFIHLPAYREPELLPTIKDALAQAKYPENLRFGICRQFHPNDNFDNVDEFRNDPRFRIIDIPYEQAKGLPYARAQINTLIQDETYILQLDAHHRFIKNWDVELIQMHQQMEGKGHKPILTGYLPVYNPFKDPEERSMEPWQQIFGAFYPHGTIFIRPTLLRGWMDMKEPAPSRFLSGHFCFARTEWAMEIKHDPDIYFSGEELNLTIRSFTHGYDMFHPHKLVIWHATMREERSGKLVWDDQHKRGEDWWTAQNNARAKIRQLLQTEDNGFNLTGYDIGSVRTIRDYEKYAGIHFKRRAVQEYTAQHQYPPNPLIEDEIDWENSFVPSFYHLVTIHRHDFPQNDYQHILVSFDDEHGMGINHKYITEYELEQFMNEGKQIHYEEMFLTHRKPHKMVVWPYSNERGWCERKEYAL